MFPSFRALQLLHVRGLKQWAQQQRAQSITPQQMQQRIFQQQMRLLNTLQHHAKHSAKPQQHGNNNKNKNITFILQNQAKRRMNTNTSPKDVGSEGNNTQQSNRTGLGLEQLVKKRDLADKQRVLLNQAKPDVGPPKEEPSPPLPFLSALLGTFPTFPLSLAWHVRTFPFYAGPIALFTLRALSQQYTRAANDLVRFQSPAVDMALTMFEQAPFYKDMVQINPNTGELNRPIILDVLGVIPETNSQDPDVIRDDKLYEFTILLAIPFTTAHQRFESHVAPGTAEYIELEKEHKSRIDFTADTKDNDNNPRERYNIIRLRVGVQSYANEYYDKNGIFHPYGVQDKEKDSFGANVVGSVKHKIASLLPLPIPGLAEAAKNNPALAPMNHILFPGGDKPGDEQTPPVFHIIHLDVHDEAANVGYAIRFAENGKDPWGVYQAKVFHEYMTSLKSDEQREAIINRLRSTPIRLHQVERQTDFMRGEENLKQRIIELEALLSNTQDISASNDNENIELASNNLTTIQRNAYIAELDRLTKVYRLYENSNTIYNPNFTTTYDKELPDVLHYRPVMVYEKAAVNALIEAIQCIHDFGFRKLVGDIFQPHHSFPIDIPPFTPALSPHYKANPEALKYPMITSMQGLVADEQYVAHPNISLQNAAQTSNYNYHLLFNKLSTYYHELQMHYLTNIEYRKQEIIKRYSNIVIDDNNQNNKNKNLLSSLLSSSDNNNNTNNNDGWLSTDLTQQQIKSLTPEQREKYKLQRDKELLNIPQWTLLSLPERLQLNNVHGYDLNLEHQVALKPKDHNLVQEHEKINKEKVVKLIKNNQLNIRDIRNRDDRQFNSHLYKTVDAVNAVLNLEHQLTTFIANFTVEQYLSGYPITPQQQQLIEQLNQYELQQDKFKQQFIINNNNTQNNQNINNIDYDEYQRHYGNGLNNNVDLRLPSTITGLPFISSDKIAINDVTSATKWLSKINGLLLPQGTLQYPDLGQELYPIRGQEENWEMSSEKPDFLPLSILPCAQWYPLYNKVAVEPVPHRLNDLHGSFGSTPNNVITDAIELFDGGVGGENSSKEQIDHLQKIPNSTPTSLPSNNNNNKEQGKENNKNNSLFIQKEKENQNQRLYPNAKTSNDVLEQHLKRYHISRQQGYHLLPDQKYRSILTLEIRRKQQKMLEYAALTGGGNGNSSIPVYKPGDGVKILKISDLTTQKIFSKYYTKIVRLLYIASQLPPPLEIPSPNEHLIELNILSKQQQPEKNKQQEEGQKENNDDAKKYQNLTKRLASLLHRIQPYSIPQTQYIPLSDKLLIEQTDLNAAEVNIRKALFLLAREHFSQYLIPDLSEEITPDIAVAWNRVNRLKQKFGGTNSGKSGTTSDNPSLVEQIKNNIPFLNGGDNNIQQQVENGLDQNKKTEIKFPSISTWFIKMPAMFKYTGMGLRAQPSIQQQEQQQHDQFFSLEQQQKQKELFQSRQRRLFHDSALPLPIPQDEQYDILAKVLPPGTTTDLREIYNPQISLHIDPQVLHRFILFSTDDGLFDVCYDGTIWYKRQQPIGHVLNQYGRMFNGTPDQKLSISLGIPQDVLAQAGDTGINPLEYNQSLIKKQQEEKQKQQQEEKQKQEIQQQQQEKQQQQRPQTLRKLYIEDDFIKNHSLYKNTPSMFESGLAQFQQAATLGIPLAMALPVLIAHGVLHAIPYTRMIATAQLIPEIYNRIGHATPMIFNPFSMYRQIFLRNSIYGDLIRTRGNTPLANKLTKVPQSTTTTTSAGNNTNKEIVNQKIGEPYQFTVWMTKANTLDPRHLSKTDGFHVPPIQSDFCQAKRSRLDFTVRYNSTTKEWLIDKVQLRINDAPHKDIEITTLPKHKFRSWDHREITFESLYGNIDHTIDAVYAQRLGIHHNKNIISSSAASSTNNMADIISQQQGQTGVNAASTRRRGVKLTQQQNAMYMALLALAMNSNNNNSSVQEQQQDI